MLLLSLRLRRVEVVVTDTAELSAGLPELSTVPVPLDESAGLVPVSVTAEAAPDTSAGLLPVWVPVTVAPDRSAGLPAGAGLPVLELPVICDSVDPEPPEVCATAVVTPL